MGVLAAGKTKFATTLAATALTAGAVATAGLGAAPSANATCASFFGIGNSAECKSTPLSIAIAIGNGATAQADGLFGAALALGTFAQSKTDDAFTFALAGGTYAGATATGIFGIAAALGSFVAAGTEGTPSLGNLGFNIALNVSPMNKVLYQTGAGGVGNLAVNLFGINDDTNPWSPGYRVISSGVLNTAANIGGKRNNVGVFNGYLSGAFNSLGSDNTVTSQAGWVNNAVNLLGSGNTVTAGPGPLALAGAIFRNDPTPVVKQQPGFNINGFRLPNTAAAVKRSSPAAATSRVTKRLPGAATASAGADTATSTPAPARARR